MSNPLLPQCPEKRNKISRTPSPHHAQGILNLGGVQHLMTLPRPTATEKDETKHGKRKPRSLNREVTRSTLTAVISSPQRVPYAAMQGALLSSFSGKRSIAPDTWTYVASMKVLHAALYLRPRVLLQYRQKVVRHDLPLVGRGHVDK